MSARRAVETSQRVIAAIVRISILLVSVLVAVGWYVLLSLPQRTGVTLSTLERLGFPLMVILVGGLIATVAGSLVSNLGRILGYGKRTDEETRRRTLN